MSKIRRDDKCHVREIRESIKTFTSPWNLTLPGPLYNQPSHEMKCESMLIIVYISAGVKDLKKIWKFWSTDVFDYLSVERIVKTKKERVLSFNEYGHKGSHKLLKIWFNTDNFSFKNIKTNKPTSAREDTLNKINSNKLSRPNMLLLWTTRNY